MRFVRLDPAPVVEASLAVTARVAVEEDRRMDRYAALGCAAVGRLLEHAGTAPRGMGDPDWGLILGSSLGCWSSNVHYFLDLERSPPGDLSPALFARTVSNAVNGEISIAHQIGGPSQTLVSGWSAGGSALAEAAVLLAEGRAEWMLAGGVEAPDEALQRMHAARRREPASAWLPQRLEDAAAVCLLAREPRDARRPGRLRLTAYGRAHDPRGTWSLAEALAALRPLSVDRILVANTVPPEVERRWDEEAGSARLVRLADRTGETGAAGAAGALCAGVDREADLLVITRGIEGGIVALAFTPCA